MRRFCWIAAGLCGALWAQAPGTSEPLTAWPYFKEVQVVPNPVAWVGLVLDRDVLDKARTSDADLRLYDRGGREIPYVLRIRRETEVSNVSTAREFNRAVEGGAAQLSCDLGEQPAEHNEVEIVTDGDNFRRLVQVDGSSDGTRWSTLVSSAVLFRFTSAGRTVQQDKVSYPVSRYRYLRVSVARDSQVDRAAPEIKTVRVRHVIQVHGETVSFDARLEPRAADRVAGRPASIWHVDLGGRIPVERLLIHTTGPAEAFSRPVQLTDVDDPSQPVVIASGELTRPESGPPALYFDERFVRHLKLTVTDDRNPPLPIGAITAVGAAREMVFPAVTPDRSPLRLYYGNPKALAPHYDLAAKTPHDLPDNALSCTVGPQQANPIFRPEPKPLSDRSPWLVYVVLAAACAALAALLVNLARTSAAAVER